MLVSSSDYSSKIRFVCKKGEPFNRQITVTSSGEPYDFTGCSFLFKVWRESQDSPVFSLTNLDGGSFDDNKILLNISKEDMIISPASYRCSLLVTLSNGDPLEWLDGIFEVRD